jgi:predicted ATPase/DNA-binding NarL/FixJ family response regulator
LAAHNLPAPPTPFIGRADELAENSALLADPSCRLLTLVGPGGAGKTRLAVEVAAYIDSFRDGIYFVSLQPLNSSEFLVDAIVDALNLSLQGQDTLRVQLLNSLRDKQMLLILDNFEHLLDGADLVVAALAAAPDIKILVTSRESLNLQEEWVRRIEGMGYPNNDSVDDIEAYSAVKLFMERAWRVRADFDEPSCAIRICQMVNGIPLAIELAAAWLKSLSCEQVISEIQRNLDFLATSWRDIPERHRSVRAVFDHSWHLLSAEEQHVFSRLSVFRGGFRPEAAARVTGASLHILASLVDKSMLRVNRSGRYDLHELLRQYAEEKLSETNSVRDEIQDRHTTYYLDFVHETEAKLKGPEQIAALDEIEADLDNIRTAWQRASALKREQELNRAVDGLALFYMMRSRAVEGERVLGQTLHDLGQVENALSAKVLLFLARFELTRDSDKSIELAQRGLTLSHIYLPPGEAGFALALIQHAIAALSYSGKDSYSDETRQLEKNLTACHQEGDRWGEAWLLYCLGALALESKNYDEAHQFSQESASIFRALGNSWAATFPLGSLAQMLTESGRYEEARELIYEVQATNRTMGDLQGIIYTSWQLAEIAYVQGDDRSLKSHVREALQIALEIQSYSAWLLLFSPLIVHLLTKIGATEQAVELAACESAAFNHMTHKTRLVDSAHQRVVEQLRVLQAELPSPVFVNAKRRGEASDKEAFTRDLLEVFLVDVKKSPAVGVRSQGLIEPLSERELEVLRLIAEGLTNGEIADKLVIAVGTVKAHTKNIYDKLTVHTRTQAVARAKKLNLV